MLLWATAPHCWRLTLDSEPGVLDFDARYTGPFRHPTGPLKAYLTIDSIDVGAIAGVDGLGRVSGNVAFEGSLMGQNPPVGHAAAEIDQIQWKGYDINSITADIDLTRTDVRGTIVADDPMLGATIKRLVWHNPRGAPYRCRHKDSVIMSGDVRHNQAGAFYGACAERTHRGGHAWP